MLHHRPKPSAAHGKPPQVRGPRHIIFPPLFPERISFHHLDLPHALFGATATEHDGLVYIFGGQIISNTSEPLIRYGQLSPPSVSSITNSHCESISNEAWLAAAEDSDAPPVLSSGGTAGVIIGGLVVLTVLGLLVYWYCKRRRDLYANIIDDEEYPSQFMNPLQQVEFSSFLGKSKGLPAAMPPLPPADHQILEEIDLREAFADDPTSEP